MPWFDRHRRYRDRLSAYLDGELDAAALGRLKRHLDDCDPCRAELEELRATVAALQQMPAPAAQRSFTLTPEQAAAPRRPSPFAARPLDFGLRIAAAGVAVALAAVVIVDAGGLTDGGSENVQQSITESREDAEETPALQRDTSYDAEEPIPTADATDPDAPVDSTGGQADGGEPLEGGAGGPAPSGSPEPAASPVPEPSGGGTEPSGGDQGFRPPTGAGDTPAATETPADATPAAAAPKAAAEGETETDTSASSPVSGDDGGIGALTVAEIALAVTLAALVAGSLGLAYTRKRS